MANDRITEVRVQGLRTLADVRLKLGGLTVLVGENGSGKSSMLEAFEILRKAAEPEFLSRLSRIHGGQANLLRADAEHLTLAVATQGEGGRVEYALRLDRGASSLRIGSETVTWCPSAADEPQVVLERSAERARVRASESLEAAFTVREGVGALDTRPAAGVQEFDVGADQLALGAYGSAAHEAVGRVLRVLRGIHVQQTLAIKPYWVGREQGERFSLRDAATVAPAQSLSRSAENINSCYQRLKNDSAEHWSETLELVRLGLGEDVESVNTESPFGGAIGLSLKLRGVARPIYAEALSDGELAYLALVALARLPGEPTLIAMDEPAAHFHPHLLVRVVEIFEWLAERCPVVLASHSDRLLDILTEPAASAVLCELAADRSTELLRPDPEALARWLTRYRGLGTLRSHGYERTVMFRKAE